MNKQIMSNNDNPSYKKLLKVAFYTTIAGMILTFFFNNSTGVFGTLLIMIAFVMAVIASIQKKRHERNQK